MSKLVLLLAFVVCITVAQTSLSAQYVQEVYRCVKGTSSNPESIVVIKYDDSTGNSYETRVGNETFRLGPYETTISLREPQWIYDSVNGQQQIYFIPLTASNGTRCSGLSYARIFRGCYVCNFIIDIAILAVPVIIAIAVFATAFYCVYTSCKQRRKNKRNFL